MDNPDHELVNKAKEILNNNNRGGFTIPTDKLYPFQWNWDSGFVAIGLGHFDLSAAIQELRSLFSGQWENGMIPHIVFHSENETTYFPNHDFWEAEVNPGAPKKPKTSGISQPPVHGFVLKQLWKQHPNNKALEDFIIEIFPKMVSAIGFYFNKRDIYNEGLFYIYHPWESGRDNSPIWDEAMNSIQLKPGDIPAYTRQDTKLAELEERPTTDQYDKFVYLLELGKKYQYDGKEIGEQSPLLVQDIMMNAILIHSIQSLIDIGKAFQLPTNQLENWLSLSKSHFDSKFWNEELGTYVSFDLKNNKQIELREIGGFIALLTGIPSNDKAEQMKDYLLNLNKRGFLLCPSFDVDHALFESQRYWRGPIWCQMNWMLYQGLKRYGFHDTAAIVRADFLDLVRRQGFYEYFEPEKRVALTKVKGYGGNYFSWTAAITIDLILAP